MSTYDDERFPFPSPGRLRRELRLRRPPLWMVATLCGVVVLTWLPLAIIARTRVSLKDQPRVHLIQDMDNQPRYGAQQPSEIFADGRAMRLPPPGSVAREQGPLDAHFTQGLVQVRDDAGREVTVFAAALPPSITLDQNLLRRGQRMYGAYCAPCHGYDGYGHGAVNERAVELGQAAWVPAMSLHDPAVIGRPDGFLFSAISNGVRTMPPHGSQIKRADRWSIVAYVRALQRSQNARIQDVPSQLRESLE